MKYAIKLIPRAQKDLDDIKNRDFEFIRGRILSLAKAPRPFGSKKLTIEEGHRIRAGNFRILYRIDDPAKEIIIYRIKHRKEAYR